MVHSCSGSTKLENTIPKSRHPSPQPPAASGQCSSISSLPPRAVRALKPLNTLLDTAAREAQHHPGLVTQPWNTEQALRACTQEGTGGKRQGRCDPRCPRAPFSHGSSEGSRAGTGDLRADRDSHTTPGYSQRLYQRHSHTQPLSQAKDKPAEE